VNIQIAGKWMFIPLKMVCIGIDLNGDLIFSKLQGQWNIQWFHMAVLSYKKNYPV
jgi:hypothetical protein